MTTVQAWNPLLDLWNEAHAGDWRWDLDTFNATAFSSQTRIDKMMQTYRVRDRAVSEYALSVPTPEAVAAILGAAPRLVELGAGPGYWAKVLSDAGGDVVALDEIATGAPNGYFKQHVGRWFDVQIGGIDTLRDHADRGLLLCWPPMNPMALEAAQAWRGEVLIYVGESAGGCTASDEFFDLLNSDFEEIAQVTIPQWYGIHDFVWILRRLPAPTP